MNAPAPPTSRRPSIYAIQRPVEDQRPVAAAVLVALGALLVLFEGIVRLLLGSVFAAIGLGPLGLGIFLSGVVVAILGIVLFATGLLVHAEPHHHVANGLLALVLVGLSLLFGSGGFFLGALLASMGGVWALFWTPTLAPMPRANPGPR
jgi:hypothetical protein